MDAGVCWDVEREMLAYEYINSLRAPTIIKDTIRIKRTTELEDFFAHGGDPGTKPQILLHLAIAADSKENFELLLKKYGNGGMYEQVGRAGMGDDYVRGSHGTRPAIGGTALHVAVALSRIEIIKLILAKSNDGHLPRDAPLLLCLSDYVGFKVASEVTGDTYKCRPLAIALANDDLEVTKLLIDAGAASTDKKGKSGGSVGGSDGRDGWDIIQSVVLHGAKKCRDYLLGKLTDAELGPSPCLLRLASGDADDLAFFLGRFPTIEITPATLHRAVFSPEASEVMRLLCSALERIQSSSTVNKRYQLMTPLVTLAYYSEIPDAVAAKCAKTLLRYGADPSIDRVGKTPRDWAAKNTKLELFQVLLDAEVVHDGGGSAAKRPRHG